MEKNILVVDDNQLILYGLARALHSGSFAVQTATTAQMAVEKLSCCPYDLCLLDVHLADLNGLELMKMIKDICPKTKFIIMTASCLDSPELRENINEAMASGACHFIAKPFNLREVTEVVRWVLTEGADFHTGFRFTGSGFVKRSRKNPRKPCGENIDFQMSVIDQGTSTRWSLEALAVDISDGGLGLLSQYPLKESQIIGFDEQMGNRTGVVAWSKMTDEGNWRVGIRFA
ncbi:MAG: response regulator [Deltaproteobacteria bacterium]|nr:response regulator [Deltaproteobacteria bacterium]